MLQNAIKAGQHFRWTKAEDGSAGEATVIAVVSDRQKGLSPESEDYVALWIRAIGISGTLRQQTFEVLLATDGKSYLDGKPITVTITEW